MIKGKKGDKAYLDGILGLVPCVVVSVFVRDVFVKMSSDREVRSWHGLEDYGEWKSNEMFSHTQVVPAKAVKWPDGKNTSHPKILPYRWEVS
jgi:hypothetical protein